MNTSTPQHTRTSAPRITRLRTCASCARTSSQKYRNWNPSTTVSTCGPRRTTGHPRAAQRGPRTTARSSSSTAAIRCAERVARTVKEATGRQTIILREQASLGRTLIEKFEHNAAKVSYAIVVLTPDDEGGRKDQGVYRPRGRQNVILEMGYFYGILGRSRVCVLVHPDVERPSDIDGIVYISFDDSGAWKTELFRELEHAQIHTDMSRAF